MIALTILAVIVGMATGLVIGVFLALRLLTRLSDSIDLGDPDNWYT